MQSSIVCAGVTVKISSERISRTGVCLDDFPLRAIFAGVIAFGHDADELALISDEEGADVLSPSSGWHRKPLVWRKRTNVVGAFVTKDFAE